MGFITRFLSSYSASFEAALLIWPFASMALTLPILAYLYHRDGHIRALSAAGAYIAVLYLMGLACFTLYPLPSGDTGPGITYGLDPILNPLHFVDDIRKDGIAPVAQLVANTALFVPLGFIVQRGLLWRWPHALVVGFAVSLVIECAQLTGLFGIYPYAYRTFETTDLITNTAGAVIGWFGAAALGRVLPARPDVEPPITDKPGFVRRMVAFCIDATLALVASLVAGAALMLALYATGAPFASLFALPLTALLGTLALVVVEVVIPWHRGGRTPGGSFVRMTFETRPRAGARRALFYAARFFVILCACGLPGIEPRFGLVTLFCLVFYLIKRKMPYDLI